MIPDWEAQRSFILQVLLYVFIGFVIVFVFVTSYIVSEERKLENKIYPNVYIDNVDVGKLTKEEAKRLFANKGRVLSGVVTTVFHHDEPVATFSATKLNIRLNIEDATEQAYLIGRVSHLPSRIFQRVGTIFHIGSFNFSTRVIFDEGVLRDFITDGQERYNKPAKNALFKFENNRVVSFQPEEKGTAVRSKDFEQEFTDKIHGLKDNPRPLVIKLEETILLPEITLAQSNQFGIEELIGEGKSDYSGSIPERVHNVILAASKFNGVLIPKGETFSFNGAIGDISSSTGYKPAYIIQGGRTVLGDGGGVCQVSTTLFRAALNTGLPIVARTAHAYRVGYYENDSKPGLDATVFSPTVDLKIKNDTPAHILVQTEVDKEHNLLYFRFYGKRDGRKAEISPITVWDVSPPPEPTHQDDPTLKKGVVKQVDFAAWGGKSRYTYKVTYPNSEVKEETFFSSYRPWRAVYLVGTGEF